MTRPPPADWQLPAGVNRALWDFLHSQSLAVRYDGGLVGSPLFAMDESFVLRHYPGPGRVVDLGCGTGRLLISLAQQGWRVVGVDLSEQMLAVARAKAMEAGIQVDLLQANIVELDALASGGFDLATCLFSTLGMVMGAEARWRVVANAARLLRPGGRFILHVHNRWFRLWDGPGRRWLLGDLLRQWRGDPQAGDHVMPAHQGIAGLTLHLFTRQEALALFRGSGLRIIEIEPVSIGHARPRWLTSWRAYGFLIAAEKIEPI